MTEKRKRDGVRSAQSSTKVLRRMLSAAAVLFVLCLVFMTPASAEDTDIFDVGEGKAYESWSSALTAATDADSDGNITYHIYGKVVLGATSQIKGDAATINIVGMTEDAELTVVTAKPEENGIVYVSDNTIETVNFIDLTLSRPNGEWRGNEGQHNRFFTVWDSDGSTDLITYTGCTFLNGSGNNQYGKTTYTDCTFYNDVYYALWIYGSGSAAGVAEVTGCTFEADRGVKIYSEDASATVTTTIKDSTFDIVSKPAIVSSIAGELTIENVNAENCEYGLLATEPKDGRTDLAPAEVTVDGEKPAYVASVGTMSTTSIEYARAEEKEDKPISLPKDDENGDSYLINSKVALEMFRDSVNAGNTYAGKTVTLTTDIDLNNEDWTPIGTSSNPFNGYFDGGEHKISNLKISGDKTYVSGGNNDNYKGLFGYMKGGNTAAITNLTIENADVSGCLYVGTVLGRSFTGGIIENCHVTGTIKVDAYSYAGGLVGRHEYSADSNHISINGCTVKGTSDNIGTVSGDYAVTYVGGIVGFIAEGNYQIIDTSVEYVTVTGVYGVGGISGIAHYGNTFSDVAVSSVTVTSNGNDLESARTDNVGLIAGACQGNKNENSYFENCRVTDSTATKNGEEITAIHGNSMTGVTPDVEVDGEKSSGDIIQSEEDEYVYYITTPAALFDFAEKVNDEGETFSGKTIKLTADIDLKNEIWTPIGLNGDDGPKFKGTFDGNDKTIYNLNVNTSLIDGYSGTYKAAGLFGATRDSTIKNLTIDGAYVEHVSSGSATVNGIAVLAGSTAYGATIENITVKNAVVKGNRYVAGIVGYADGTIKNCHVENVTLIATPDDLTGSYDNGDKVGGIVGYTNSNIKEISDCTAEDVSITAYRDAGGIVGCIILGMPATSLSGNSVSNIEITIDQFTNSYGEETTNAGAVVGRFNSNPDKETIVKETPATNVKVTTIDTTGEITVDLGFSYEIDTVYLTGDSTSGYSVLENSVIHLPLNYSVTAESSPADVWYVTVTVTDENEAPVQVAHSLSSSVIEASYFQYHEDKKVYQVSNNGLVGVDKDTPALFKLDLETAALDAGKKYNVTIEITTVATTDIVGEASLYSYDAVSELEIQIGIDAWVISVDHNLYNTKEDGAAVTNPWGLENRANIVYKVKNPYNGKDTTYFSNEDNTIVKRNADAPYGLNLSGSVKQTIVKIVGGEEKAVAAGTKITAENGKLVMTVADADLDANSFKITFDGQKAGDLSNIKAFPDTIDVIDANYILKELAATGNYIPADFKVFADVTKDARIDTDDATLVFFFGLNKLADEQKTSVELEYPTA